MHVPSSEPAQDSGITGVRGDAVPQGEHRRDRPVAELQDAHKALHKRVYRFLSNTRVEAAEACQALIALAASRAQGHLFVAVDWTDIRDHKVLKASVPLGGRSVPVLFAAYRKWEVYKSQNSFEEGLFRLLRALVPARVQVVVLADTGFARAELLRTLQELSLELRDAPSPEGLV